MMSLTRTRGTGSYTPHFPSLRSTSWCPVFPLYSTTWGRGELGQEEQKEQEEQEQMEQEQEEQEEQEEQV